MKKILIGMFILGLSQAEAANININVTVSTIDKDTKRWIKPVVDPRSISFYYNSCSGKELTDIGYYSDGRLSIAIPGFMGSKAILCMKHPNHGVEQCLIYRQAIKNDQALHRCSFLK